jgi:ribosomal protein S12 methylthiotransferase accessory factor
MMWASDEISPEWLMSHVPLFKKVSDLAHPNYGIFQRFRVSRRLDFGKPLLSVSLKTHPLFHRGEGVSSETFLAQGSGTHLASAARRAIGEALERGCSLPVGHEPTSQRRYLFGTQSEVSRQGEALPLEGTEAPPMLSEEMAARFDFSKSPAETPCWWTSARCAFSEREIFLPSQWVHYPYQPQDSRSEKAFDICTTSGLACGDSWEQAALGATLELIERDAFSLHWFLLPRHRPRRLSSEILLPLTQSAELKERLFVLDLTTDLDIPVVALFLRGRPNEAPFLCLGASCQPDLRRAAFKAFLEMSGCFAFTQHWKMRGPPLEARQIQTFHDHARHWIHRTSSVVDEWLDSLPLHKPENTAEERNSSDTSHVENWLKIKSNLKNNNKRLYLIDLTPSLLKERGLHIVRAYCPDLQPLPMGDGIAHVKSQRLQRYYEQKTGEAYGHEKINPLPHPFP